MAYVYVKESKVNGKMYVMTRREVVESLVNYYKDFPQTIGKELDRRKMMTTKSGIYYKIKKETFRYGKY